MSEIKHAYPLILNKVASPHYATPILRRARLLDWLNEASTCRAAVIAADAGYGKTTLLYQWEREVKFPCYWYKLDRNDRDWTFHVSYLIEAIAKRHPGFGRRAHSMLQQLGGPGSSRPGVAAYLLAEMHQRLTEPCTFIIDDWQYVNAVTEVRGLWNQILRDAPPTCRFVFASRAKPKLQFARFKTHSGYAELRTDALRFTEDEIAELFRDVYNDPLDPSEVSELERRTEGWAASLQLVEVSLRERNSADERLEFIRSITATKDSDLFDFLAEEVLDQQPEQTRNFLLSTSILQQITPEVAERLAGVHDGRRELTDLEHRGLFTNRLDEHRYRYHNLFREFLERRLVTERSESEVVGLHIHAASYFETTEQWPEAIHHYLRAGLQRQAARLIAKYGEDVVAAGGLGLVDQWLQELPEEAIRGNARLALLSGEAAGVRGDWDLAVESLERARTYFARKGDRRMEALACLKLSTVHFNYGDVDRAADVADAGLSLTPQDALATRLRLEGNLAVSRGWLKGSIQQVVDECHRIEARATALGLDHFAAIAQHNAGDALLQAGRLSEALIPLRRAADYWGEPPTSPFADNANLVIVLLALGRLDEARQTARDALRSTAPWRRPSGHARYANALVKTYEGRFEDAISDLAQLLNAGEHIGALRSQAAARLVEAMYLSGRSAAELVSAAVSISTSPRDLRYLGDTVAARALARHFSGDCRGECQAIGDELVQSAGRGEALVVIVARVKVGTLSFAHRRRAPQKSAWAAFVEAIECGIAPYLKWWLRSYANPTALGASVNVPGALEAVAIAAEADPAAWSRGLVSLLASTGNRNRPDLIKVLRRVGDAETTHLLANVPGADVAALRANLRTRYAGRLFVRTFGRLAVRRDSWDGQEIRIEKKRIRALLGALAGHSQEPPTRDALVDMLWPDADADSAVNSLNQTVFQLRRALDSSYRAGESADYVLSSSEQVTLNLELVRTDLSEFERASETLMSGDWAERNAMAHLIARLLRGTFLAELCYEDWASRLQQQVHGRVRQLLLPAADEDGMLEPAIRLELASALIALDPYDEAAVIAMARSMAASGRIVAAQNLMIDYIKKVQDEFDDTPSPGFAAAAEDLTSGDRVKRVLTAARGGPSGA